jgi:hypothetical protein
MREIRFRAWDEHDLDGKGAMICWELILEDGFHNYYGAPGVILMQFTGLKDKNGKDIYEGDWVQFLTFCAVGVVTYRPPEFIALSRLTIVRTHEVYSLKGYDVEVIGNIYENPELLSGTTLVQDLAPILEGKK